jgi:F0F1-type ATP synthase alpha subunit
VKGYLDKVTEARIQRMRQAQLENLHTKYQEAKGKLEAKRAITTAFSLKLQGMLWLNERPEPNLRKPN